MSLLLLAQFLLVLFLPRVGSVTPECHPTRCRKNGPLIRFPFRIQHLHPHRCGYPGFELYCNENGETLLQLPSSVNVSVRKIDYASQWIEFYDPCFARKVQKLNLSSSPFSFNLGSMLLYDNYVLFNCSASSDLKGLIPCLDVNGYKVFYQSSYSEIDRPYFTNCTKIFEVHSVPLDVFDKKQRMLYWSEPDCWICESNHSFCSLKNSSGGNQIRCIPKPNGAPKTPLIAGATVGSMLFVATLAALFYVYRSIQTGKKVEKFLKDYKTLKPTRFSYADIKRITKNFTEKLGEGGYGIVYKGKVSKEIYVAVKVLNNSKGNGEEFVNEVNTIGSIHHVNIVRLVGFCADGYRRAIVYDYLSNESLEKIILQNGSIKKSLTWEKIQEVAIGIAKGIEYLHQGCDQQILHFDIKPHNIMLDHNLNPKICDFGLAKFCSKEQSAVSMTEARGTMGYIAPEMMSRTFGRVSYKSDVYSFGMVLLEMVGAGKDIDIPMDTSQVFFPKWVYDHLSEGGELLRTSTSGDEDKIVKKLVVVGLWCIQWYPTDRPSMKTVVQMLEGDGESLSLPPNPFPNTSAANLAIVLESDDNLIVQ